MQHVWCERCYTHHFPGDHDDRDLYRRRRRSSSGPALSTSRRSSGEWLDDLASAVVGFFVGLFTGGND